MEEHQQLARYEELLRSWSAKINLVGPEALRNLDAHVAEALEAGDCLAPTGNVLDVGSGGGLPGVPIAIRFPDARLHFVEADQRKWAFLKTVIRECSLNAVAHGDRLARVVERLDPALEFTLVTSRAVGHPESWLPLVRNRIEKGGSVALFEGNVAGHEIEGFSVDRIFRLSRGDSNFLVTLRRL